MRTNRACPKFNETMEAAAAAGESLEEDTTPAAVLSAHNPLVLKINRAKISMHIDVMISVRFT